nr:ADP-L-glycero-D-manno-heptose-6-epimerase [uncultured bacterium]
MRVLVTGGAGFIGSQVAKLLEVEGDKVVVVDDFSHGNYKNLSGLRGEVICHDIRDNSILKKLPRFDAVIHEAAVTDTTLTDNSLMVSVNFNGFNNVLEYCLSKKIRLVYASSAGVYGSGSSVMKESQEPTPHNTYAYSKLLCDLKAAKFMKQSAKPIVGLRYFNVYGPGEYHKGASASMIYQLYQQMLQNKQPRIFKYGEQKRDFIYVKDVARLTVAALKAKRSAIINVGTGQARSFNDIVTILNRVLEKDLDAAYFDNPYASVYQNFTQADTALLKSTLKSQAHYSLEEGIQDYVKKHLAGRTF